MPSPAPDSFGLIIHKDLGARFTGYHHYFRPPQGSRAILHCVSFTVTTGSRFVDRQAYVAYNNPAYSSLIALASVTQGDALVYRYSFSPHAYPLTSPYHETALDLHVVGPLAAPLPLSYEVYIVFGLQNMQNVDIVSAADVYYQLYITP